MGDANHKCGDEQGEAWVQIPQPKFYSSVASPWVMSVMGIFRQPSNMKLIGSPNAI